MAELLVTGYTINMNNNFKHKERYQYLNFLLIYLKQSDIIYRSVGQFSGFPAEHAY